MFQDAEKRGLPVESVSARLMKVRLNVKGESNDISFLVTDPLSVSNLYLTKACFG